MKRFALATAVAALVTAAGASAAGAATVEGVCTLGGTATFEKPLSPIPTEMSWTYVADSSEGRCTGLVNNHLVIDTPTGVTVEGHGLASCGVLTATPGARGYATFPEALGDQRLDFTMDLVSVGFQNTLRLTGEQGGTAVGRASIVGVQDPIAVLQRCAAGNGDRVFQMSVTAKTLGPLKG